MAELAGVLAAKAAGAAHLDELTAGLDLDAFVLFSSVAATWGSGMQAGYAAANAFLDALAEHRRAAGWPATSVAWGLWGGGGMGEPGRPAAQLRRRGLRVMDPGPGASRRWARCSTAGKALRDGRGRGLGPVRPGRSPLRRPSPLLADLPEVRQALAAAATAGAGRRPGRGHRAGPAAGRPAAGRAGPGADRAGPGRGRRGAGHASPEAVEAGRAFQDLGFDSLTAVELRDRLNAATGLRLPATLVFDYPTPVVAGRVPARRSCWASPAARRRPR